VSHVLVLVTVLLTVYAQLIVKWQVVEAGPFPHGLPDQLLFLFRLVINPWIISVYLAALAAGLAWMAAMTKLQLSYAYPFMSLSFVFVLVLSAVFFHEPVTWQKSAGIALVVLGLAIGSQG
jgi:drug/metabolite transporter (DMT)-like permease